MKQKKHFAIHSVKSYVTSGFVIKFKLPPLLCFCYNNILNLLYKQLIKAKI